MPRETRQFLTIIAIGLVLFTVIVTDSHRHAIAAVWPYLEAFWDYQTK